MAENFVVTSNASSGPGTLHEAMLKVAANGTSEIDYISFNLPGSTAADFTIKLTEQLPELTNETVIDGGTQPGNFLFEFNTKIRIESPDNFDEFTIFRGKSIQNVQFYRLFLYDYTDEIVSRPATGRRVIIEIKDCINIFLGEAGRGNLIRGGNQHCMRFEDCQGIQLRGNMFGWDTSRPFDYQTGPITFDNCGNINLGGDGAGMGNIFYLSTYITFRSVSTFNGVWAKGNNFGVREDEHETLWFVQSKDVFLRIETDPSFDPSNYLEAEIHITDNVFWNFHYGVRLRHLKGKHQISGNYYGLSRQGVPMQLSSAQGQFLDIDDCRAEINVGDETAGGNRFMNAWRPVYAAGSDHVHLSRNEFSCIAMEVFNHEQPSTALPPIEITSTAKTGNNYTVSGKSAPSAVVEVYSSQLCNTFPCQPHAYLASVTADQNGDWVYSTNQNPIVYFFSATLDGQSSEFKQFDVSEHLVIRNASCNNTGAVEGLEAYAPFGLKIYNQNRDLILPEAYNALPVGTYQIAVDGGCKESSFEIKTESPVVFGVPGSVIADASCGLDNGSVILTGFAIVPSRFEWRDENGGLRSTAASPDDLAPGTYEVTGFDQNNCSTLIGSYRIGRLPEPVLVTAGLSTEPDVCGSGTGRILGLDLQGGTSGYSFEWFSSAGFSVSAELQAKDLKADVYTLRVKSGSCTRDFPGFVVGSTDSQLEVMTQPDVKVCSPGEVRMNAAVHTKATGYRLYDLNERLLEENSTGAFSLSVNDSQRFKISYLQGSCESNKAEFSVEITASNINVPSAFSPNGDGTNDQWIITGLENYPKAVVTVVNRYGETVFKGTGKSTFNGFYNGNPLQAGVYYYVISISRDCKQYSGSLIILR